MINIPRKGKPIKVRPDNTKQPVPYIKMKVGNRISIVVRPYAHFEPDSFRRHDIGRPGHSFRVVGILKKGYRVSERKIWDTHSFQILKSEVKIIDNDIFGRTAPTAKTIATIKRNYGKITSIAW